MSQTGRFFRPKWLLVPLGFLFAALLVAAFVAQKLFAYDTLSIGGVLMVLALLVLGVGTVALAFPRGCKRCGVLLEGRSGVYHPHLYDPLAALIAQPTPDGVAQAATQRTMEVLQHRARVCIDACPQCARVLTIQVLEERWKGQHYDATRYTKRAEFTDDVAAALFALVG